MMESGSADIVHDPQGGSTKNEGVEPETVLGGERGTVEGKKGEMECGDVNMSADDVMRAGGFGARDDISSFLPVASDSTDFEASLRDARDYEEPQKEICRPGLGWKDAKE